MKESVHHTSLRTSKPSGLSAGKAGRGLLNGKSGIDVKSARTKMPPRRIGPSPDAGYGVDVNAFTVIQQWRRAFIPDFEEGSSGSLVPKDIIFEGGVWKVVWGTAKATEHSYKNAGKSHAIKFGAGDLSTPPIPPFPLATGNNDFYLKFEIDKTGIIKDDSVELTTSDPVTKVVKPTRPHNGDDNGIYKQSVGRITVSTTAPPVWTPYNTGTQLFSFIPEIEELGGGEGIFKTWTNGKDQVRTLNNAPGDGETIVKTGSTDEILFRRIANHAGLGVGLVDVSAAGADSIKILRVREKESQPQLTITAKSDGTNKWAEFRGNSKDVSFSDLRKFNIDVLDGFVANLMPSGVEDWTGKVEIVVRPATPPYTYLVFHIYNGAITGIDYALTSGSSGGGEGVPVPGTIAAPGSVIVFIDQ